MQSVVRKSASGYLSRHSATVNGSLCSSIELQVLSITVPSNLGNAGVEMGLKNLRNFVIEVNNLRMRKDCQRAAILETK
jgi:hypothetical protein